MGVFKHPHPHPGPARIKSNSHFSIAFTEGQRQMENGGLKDVVEMQFLKNYPSKELGSLPFIFFCRFCDPTTKVQLLLRPLYRLKSYAG